MFLRLFLSILLAGTFTAQAGEDPPPRCVFKPTFMTGFDSFSGGTAFICKNPVGKGQLLITAMHLFGPACGLEKQYNAKEIQKTFIAATGLSMSNPKIHVTSTNPILIVGSNVSEKDGSSGDIAAYRLTSSPILNALKFSTVLPKAGDVVHMFARQRGSTKLESLKATIVTVSKEEIVYSFTSPKLNLAGTSGAPIINTAGDVVALNTAGGKQNGKLYGFGNPAASMIQMLRKSSIKKN